MTSRLAQLFAHLRWADRRTLEGLRSLPNRDERAHRWYAHILGSEHTWLSRIEGRPPRLPVWPEISLEDCEALAAENHAAFDALARSLDDAALDRVVRYTTGTGDTYESQLGDILLHVALHGQYHRGQVAAAVREGGGTPVATDYIVFTRGEPLRMGAHEPAG